MAMCLHKSASCITFTNPSKRLIQVYSLQSWERGKGHAKELLSIIFDEADTRGYEVSLTAAPYRDKPVCFNRLVRWYKNQGFRIMYVDRECTAQMVRSPRFRLTEG